MNNKEEIKKLRKQIKEIQEERAMLLEDQRDLKREIWVLQGKAF